MLDIIGQPYYIYRSYNVSYKGEVRPSNLAADRRRNVRGDKDEKNRTVFNDLGRTVSLD